jgi:hypothetical protein
MSNIYTIRLTSGEELVTQVDQDSEEYVKMDRWHTRDFLTLIDPTSVMPSQQGLGGGPFTFTGDTKRVNISTKAVALVVSTKPEFEETYKSQSAAMKNPNSRTESPLMM